MGELKLGKLKATRVLGRGAMGTVFLAKEEAITNSLFALKVVEKSTLRTKFDADRRARWEMSVLSRLSHPFLPTLLGVAETPEYMAWAIPYCPCGDLNQLRHRQTDQVFSHSAIRFYVAEIVCAIEYLHDLSIVYRDLKPENVLVQASGHVMLADFDLSRVLSRRRGNKDVQPCSALEKEPSPAQPKHRRQLTRMLTMVSEKSRLKKAKSARVSPVSRRKRSLSDGERSNSFVGTEEYVPPEVVRGDGHEFSVDWWSLGVLTYEMTYGRTPFRGENRKETFRNVLTKPPEVVGRRSALTDFVLRLLEKDPTKRLGYQRGAAEVKEHAFFSGLRWDLLTGVARPPFLATVEDSSLTSTLHEGDEFCITDYFEKPPLSARISASSLPSPSFEYRRNVSSTEY